MRKFKFFLFFISFMVMHVASFPQEKAAEMKHPEQFRQRLSGATARTSSIESNFTQEKNMSVLSEKIVSRGKFYFRKKNLLRWEYTDPFSYLIILNNGKILVKDDEKENRFDASSNKVFAEINSVLLGCAQGTLLNDEKNFQPSYFETPGSYLVKLMPKNPQLKKIFSGIFIYFDKNDLSVTRLVMNEHSGDYTAIDFSAKRLNTPIPDEKFSIH